jgi:hypothetical protein
MNDLLYACCVHCLDHEDMLHDDPCTAKNCPGAESEGGDAE